MKAKAAIHFDSRRAKNNDKYPIKIRITYLRLRKYYKTGYDVSEKDWIKLNTINPRKELKSVKDKTEELLDRAEAIIEQMEQFSFLEFEKQFLPKPEPRIYLVDQFNAYIEDLKRQGRLGTAESYQSAVTSLTAYRKQVKLTEITPEFLLSYEQWMLNKGNSATTVGIYLRSLRSIINAAIEVGVLKAEQYPFGRRRYVIPAGQNIKKAITIDDVSKLYYHTAEPYSPIDKARDFWLFSYLANGMNFQDICRLKVQNIQQDHIVFFRTKTRRANKGNPLPITIVLDDDLQRIIHKWGSISGGPDDYLFAIINGLMSEKERRKRIRQFIKTTNKWLGRICKQEGISSITTYSARHTFSTILKNSGAPVEFIRDALGHSNMITTRNYLSAYPDAQKKGYIELLTTFKSALPPSK